MIRYRRLVLTYLLSNIDSNKKKNQFKKKIIVWLDTYSNENLVLNLKLFAC